MLTLQNQKNEGTHHDIDMCVLFFQQIPFQFPPVNLNIYPLSIYNHMDAVTKILGLGDMSVKSIS